MGLHRLWSAELCSRKKKKILEKRIGFSRSSLGTKFFFFSTLYIGILPFNFQSFFFAPTHCLRIFPFDKIVYLVESSDIFK